jgi:hypothetical protein
MATVPAVVGAARLGNFRLGYMPAAVTPIREARVRILIGGVVATSRVRVASLSIHNVINDAPDTCAFEVSGTPPASGQQVRVTLNSNDPRLLFNGTIQTADQTYEGKPTHLVYACLATDDTARLNYRRPFGIWTNVSATTVAQELIASFAPGFTATHVEAGLPAITVVFDGSEGFSSALRQIAKLIGGYFYVEDLDLHLFLTEATDAPLDLDTTPGRFLNDPPITASSDDSQLRTRVYGRGHGEVTLMDLPVGVTMRSIIPIADAAMYNASGGQVIVSTTPDGSPTEILTYTGLMAGGGGALVGPGVRPSVQPTATASAGAGLGSGLYRYAYTFVTASGETLESPLAAVTTSATVSAPTVAPVYGFAGGGGGFSLGWYTWAYTYVTASGETTAGPRMTPQQFTATSTLTMTVGVGGPGTTQRKLYRTVACASAAAAAAAQLKLAATLADNTTTTYLDGATDASLGANVPIVNTAGTLNQVVVSGIAVGPAGTTSRKLYRTVVAGAQLKLHTTIADNTTTTIATDSTADGALGANVPVVDTSGLIQATGQVNPGAGAIPVTSTAPFSATGGFVQTESGEIVFYFAVIPSTNSLSGLSSFGTAIPYGSQLVPLPALKGVTGTTKDIQRGSVVHVWVRRDDLVAQAAAAARESTAEYTSDGIHEHLLVDERRGEASLTSLCSADLALFSMPLVTVSYATRDPKTKAGKPLVVNLASPLIAETLVIQDVTITEIDVAPGLLPRFTATASTVRQSLEDLLRRMNALVVD